MEFDALIITALYEELTTILSITDDTRKPWDKDRDSDGFPYHYRIFKTSTDEPLCIAAAWSGEMGETAAADRSKSLISHLHPLCLGMSGICAGRRGDVFLGDVIAANRVFSYDHGKLIAVTNANARPTEELFHDIETYNLEKVWAMDAKYFASKKSWCDNLIKERPISMDFQSFWLLRTLFEHENEGAPTPNIRTDRKDCCPKWPEVILSLEKDKLIRIQKGTASLTQKGREFVLNHLLVYPDGLPNDPPFNVHVGPIGTGKAVREDPQIFNRISKSERKVIGLEMEAAAIGYVAETAGIPSIVVKGVSDYADEKKDDSFRTFASKASANFLLSFLRRHPPKSLLKRKDRLLPSAAVDKISDQVAAKVLSSLIAEDAVISLPKHKKLERFLFYCYTDSGEKLLGVSLNNSGLIMFSTPNPNKLKKVVSVSTKSEYKVTRQIAGNEIIKFAYIKSDTEGIVPSYLNYKDDFLKGDVADLVGFDYDGQLVPIKISGFAAVVVIKHEDESFSVRNLLQCKISSAKKSKSDAALIGGPIFNYRNEFVGHTIATFTLASSLEKVFFIWPWVSLSSCIQEMEVDKFPFDG